jgi:hypothetical protein
LRQGRIVDEGTEGRLFEQIARVFPRANKNGNVVLDYSNPKQAEEILPKLRRVLNEELQGAVPRNVPMLRAIEKALEDISMGIPGASLTIKPDDLAMLARNVTRALSETENAGSALAQAAMRYRKEILIPGSDMYLGERLVRTVEHISNQILNPLTQKIGQTSPEVREIVGGAINTAARVKMDTTRVLEDALRWGAKNGVKGSDATKQAAIRFLDGEAATVTFQTTVKSPLYGKTTGTLFEQGKALLVGLDRSEDAAFVHPSVTALARMWLPSGINVTEKQGKRLAASMYSALEGADSFAAFADTMRKLTGDILSQGRATSAGRVKVAGAERRAYGFAMQAMGQAAVDNRMARQIMALQLRFTPEDAEALMRIANSTEHTADAAMAQSFNRAIALLDRMGMPPKLRKVVAEEGKNIEAGLIMMNRGETTQAALIPAHFFAATNESLGKITKELEAYSRLNLDTAGKGLLNFVQSYFRLLRVSMTTGVIYHTPRYYANMFFGNISQIIADPLGGFSSAARSGTQMAAYGTVGAFQTMSNAALGKRAPDLAKGLDRLHDIMVDKYGIDGALPSIVSTIWNPHVARFMDATSAPDSMVVRLSNGQSVTMGFLREEALKGGVLSSYASADLMNLLSREAQNTFNTDLYQPFALFRQAYRGATEADAGIANRAMGAVRGAAPVANVMRPRLPFAGKGKGTVPYMQRRAQILADTADMVEQRQRVALYLDMVVNRGKSTDEAARLVRSALYDWNHALSSVEAKYINEVVLFWRFWKLALKQSGRILTEGFLRGFSGKSMGLAPAMGKTALGRLGIQNKLLRAAEQQNTPDPEDVYMTDQVAMMNRDRYASWMASRGTPMAGNMPATEAEVLAYQQVFGKEITNIAYALPNLTPFDGTSMLLSLLSATAKISTALLSGDPGEAQRAATVQVGTTLSYLGSMAPVSTAPLFIGLHETYVGDSRIAIDPNASITLSPAEAKLYQALGFDTYGHGASTTRPEDAPARHRLSARTVNLMRALPVVGNEIPYWLNPIIAAPALAEARVGEDAGFGERLRAQTSYIARQYSNFYKEYGTNPQFEREMNQLRTGRRIEAKIKDLERRQYRRPEQEDDE